MKKLILLISVLFLVGCSPNSELETALAEVEDLKTEITQKQNTIGDLEEEVKVYNELINGLRTNNDVLKAELNLTETTTEDDSVLYLCDSQLENMKYESTFSATAILDGWFAQQPQARLIQGTYSTTFWDGVKSTIHTIRYISDDTGLTTTSSFMLFFEEAGWKPGLLWMTEQCWLDFPG